MALGDLVLDETGQVTATRILSTDASGTNMELSLTLNGTIRGVQQTTMWTYTTLTRADGSIYGNGQGLMTTQDGDVIHLIGHGSGAAPPPGGTVRFCTMLHAHGATGKYADLNTIGLAGEYEVDPEGNATNKCWEWK